MNIVVCIKQVPAVSELKWDQRTGRLERETAEGMINPACRHALEAALKIKERHGGRITVITMGPPMAEEAVREALVLGADAGVVLTDPRLAGADTLATSYTLARAIETAAPDFDLILCGFATADSETAQVGPQLAEELDIPGASGVEQIELNGRTARMQRLADNFMETLEMDLPGLATISTKGYPPRYVPLTGLEPAFDGADVRFLDAEAIGADPARIGRAGSATEILSVAPATAEKQGLVLKGSPKRVVDRLLNEFSDLLGGAIGQDLNPED